MLMSATLSPELKSLKKIALHSPVVLKLEEDEKVDSGKLSQFYLELPKADKRLVIYVFLKVRFRLFLYRSERFNRYFFLFWVCSCFFSSVAP